MDTLEEKISNQVAEWKKFGRLLDLEEGQIGQIDNDYETTIEKTFECMRLANNFKEGTELSERWSYWRSILEKFDDGKRVIRELETSDEELSLCDEAQSNIRHHTIGEKSTGYLFHQYDIPDQYARLPIDMSRKISLNVGAEGYRIIYYKDFIAMLESRKEYYETYKALSDKNVFDMNCDTISQCPILKTLNYFFENECKGVAVKGFSVQNNYSLYGAIVVSIDQKSADRFLIYFEEQNIMLHVIKCRPSEINKAVHEASSQHCYVVSVFDFLEDSLIIHMGVVLYEGSDTPNCHCNECLQYGLVVSEVTFSDPKLFREWFRIYVSENQILKDLRKQMPKKQSASRKCKITEKLKEHIVGYQALNDDSFPTFARGLEPKMEEAKKLVFLTPAQSNILKQNHKHVIITGGYGSGKSLIIQKKFEAACQTLTDDEILFMICHDQQSKFASQMKYFKNKYPSKNVLICNSKTICENTCQLSSILQHLVRIWWKKKIHIFMDEFSCSSIDENEIREIKKELENHYKSSLVYIAFQSMAFKEKHDIEAEGVNEPFQYKKLEKETDFVVFELDYIMRCSVEIHDLLKSTVHILQDAELHSHYRPRSASVIKSHYAILDREHGLLHAPKDSTTSVVDVYSYMDLNKIGHDISSGKPRLYEISESLVDDEKLKMNAICAIIHDIIDTHNDNDCDYGGDYDDTYDDKHVIITYDNEWYRNIHAILSLTEERWTTSIRRFNKQESKYKILFTDSASIRGYEYKNVTLVLPLDQVYLKYRLIETLSRATLYLSIVAITTHCNDPTIEKILSMWKTDYLVDHTMLYPDNFGVKNFICKPALSSGMSAMRNMNFEFSPSNVEYPWKRAEEQESQENFTYQDVRNAFYMVCENDDVNLFEELLETHQVDVTQYRYRYYEPSLLYPATRCNSVKIMRILLDKFKFEVNGRYSETPVHQAAKGNKNEAMKLLLDHGGDPNSRILDNETPLHWAARSNSLDVVRTLLDHGAETNSLDDNEDTPLHNAASYNNKEIILVLLKHGASINARNKDGTSALHKACYNRCHGAVIVLLQKGANIYAEDNKKNTPLHMAVKKSNKRAIELLFGYNVSADISNEEGDTALHEAVRQKRMDVFTMIVENTENVNIVNKESRSPLHEAVAIDNIEMVIEIMKRGGNLLLEDSFGITPIDLAKSNTQLHTFLQSLQEYEMIVQYESIEGFL